MMHEAASIEVSGAVRVLPAAARFNLRGAPDVMNAAGTALSLALSHTPCRASVRDDIAALWLGPDEQLILAPKGASAALTSTFGEALRGMPHSLVEISHRHVALEVSGAQAPLILNAGCPLDLHPQVFTVGTCTRTVLGKAEIILWKTREAAFHIEVWRSFAPYVEEFLAEAQK